MGTIFSANDIRGRIDESLTVEYVWNVGKALSESLGDEGNVVVVKSQNADQSTVRALIEGLLLQGRNVIDAGEGDAQTANGAISDTNASGGAYVSRDDVQNLEVITLFDGQGVIMSAENGLDSINQLAEAGNFVPAAVKGTLKTIQ